MTGSQETTAHARENAVAGAMTSARTNAAAASILPFKLGAQAQSGGCSAPAGKVC